MYGKWKSFTNDFITSLLENPIETFSKIGILCSLFYSLQFLYLDSIFFNNKIVTKEIISNPILIPIIFIGVLITYFINLWLINSELIYRSLSNMKQYKRWINCARFLISGIPLWGLLILPLWKWIEETKPSWAIRKNMQLKSKKNNKKYSNDFNIQRKNTIVCNKLKWIGFHFNQKIGPVWYTLINFTIILLITFIFIHFYSIKIINSFLAKVFILSFHILIFLFLMLLSNIQVKMYNFSGIRKIILILVPFIFLVPVPGLFIIGLTIYLILLPKKNIKEQTLIFKAIEEQNKGSSDWFNLETKILQYKKMVTWWRHFFLEIFPLTSHIFINSLNKFFFPFAWVKCLSLISEFAGLTWILCWLGTKNSTLNEILKVTLMILVYLFIGLFILGLLFAIFRFIQKIMRISSPLDGYPYQTFGILISICILTGFCIGFLCFQQDFKLAFYILIAITSLLILSRGFFIILSKFLNIQKEIPWDDNEMKLFLIVVSILLVLFVNIINKNEMVSTTTLLANIFILHYFISTIMGIFCLNKLLGKFNPNDMFSNSLPISLRIIIAIIVLTTIIPTGGIGIPFLIFSYHKLLPHYEHKILLKKQ